MRRPLFQHISALANNATKMDKHRHLSVIKLNASDKAKCAIEAAQDLKSGGIIAVPTDTIYGVACLVQIRNAVDKLYLLKGRHPEKPISICLAEIDDLFKWSRVTVSKELLSELLPGPVTLCFDRLPPLNPDFNPGARLIGIRIPDHSFVRQICRNVQGNPVALTSANVSQAQSCLDVSEFINDLGAGLSKIFDGGRLCSDEDQGTKSRQGSTIIDLSNQGHYKVIRNGSALHETVAILEKHGLLKAKS